MVIIEDSISKAAFYLKTDVIAIPTETVYGLAGNALDEKIVARIFEVKDRPSFDPLIVHTHSIDEIEKFVMGFPDELKILADKFWPGPLTLLLPRNELIPDIVTSGLSNVAVRIPNHALTLELLKSIDFPLAAPSANPFGYVSPTRALHVNDQLGDKIPFILDGGPSQVGLESTIVGFENEQITIYRLGGIPVEQIVEICGPVVIKSHSSNPLAPGMIDSHYSPRKKLILGNVFENFKKYKNENPVVICFDKYIDEYTKLNQLLLSPNSSMTEAATNLFATLRQADKLQGNIILIDKVDDVGLGRAINDRLTRSSSKA